MKMPNAPTSRMAKFGLISAVLFSSGFLFGCGVAGEGSLNPIVEEQKVVGTNGQLISIQSDNVRAAGYDVSSMIMTVQFNNGYTYEYYGIPLELWDSFIAAQPNPWSLVGYPRLVQAGVPYKRIS
jgi:hypothetical protein